MENPEILDEWVVPGQTVLIRQTITIVHEVRVADVADESGVSVKEAISDIPRITTVSRVLGRTDIWEQCRVEDIETVTVDIV